MEVRYLRSPAINKEAYVQDILAERGRDPGFVAILSCVEPCRSYQILGKLLEPVTQRTTFNGSSVRALRPFDQDDHALLRAISQGQFALQGFRNADIRGILNISPGDSDPQARKRQAAAMTRRFRLLRAHGIIQKIHATHRYQLTDFGRALTAAVISAHRASLQKLTSGAQNPRAAARSSRLAVQRTRRQARRPHHKEDAEAGETPAPQGGRGGRRDARTTTDGSLAL
ncbi:MAG: hypothetical protein U0795_11790 [Pirellulales bacterium]